MRGVLIGVMAVLGLVIGSFLNVVIYGVPRGLSSVRPVGMPVVRYTHQERDNVPVVSWLLLGAAVRNCRPPFRRVYPLVELACAGLFAGTAARFGYSWDLPAFLVCPPGCWRSRALMSDDALATEDRLPVERDGRPAPRDGGGVTETGTRSSWQPYAARMVRGVFRHQSVRRPPLGFR